MQRREMQEFIKTHLDRCWKGKLVNRTRSRVTTRASKRGEDAVD